MKVTISVGGKFHAFHLAEQLQKRGVLQKIVTGYPSFMLRNEAVEPMKVVSHGFPTLLVNALNRTPFLKGKMALDKWHYTCFDALARRHASECDIFVGWAGYVLRSMRHAKRCGRVTVLERHSAHVHVQQEILKEEYERYGILWNGAPQSLLDRQLREYEQADYISVPSTFVGDTFIKKGVDSRRIIRVSLGVNRERFFYREKTDETFRILFVGGLCLRKGVQYLLQAVRELKLPDAELVLLGGIDPDFQPVLQKYSGSFSYGGIIPQDQLRDYYSRASLFVFPSLEDGFGMVVSEAMACGVPVIVSENTGARDIVRNGKDGFIVPVRDVESLKEKILTLYQDRHLRAEMSHHARRRAAEFTWDRYGEEMVRAYDRILGERPAGSVDTFERAFKYGAF